MVAVRDPDGATEVLEAPATDDAAEARSDPRLVATVRRPIPT